MAGAKKYDVVGLEFVKDVGLRVVVKWIVGCN